MVGIVISDTDFGRLSPSTQQELLALLQGGEALSALDQAPPARQLGPGRRGSFPLGPARG